MNKLSCIFLHMDLMDTYNLFLTVYIYLDTAIMTNAAEPFPINPPQNKEEYYYRSIFEEHFPSQSAARSVPSVPSVACSTAEALAWDATLQGKNDPSGRAVADVHEAAYTL